MYKAEWAQKPATYTQSLTLKKQPPPLLYIYCSLGTQDSARNRTVSALRKLTLCWSDSYSRANRTTIRGTSASEKTARGQGAGGSLRVDREPLWERVVGAEPWGATQVSVLGRGNSVQEAGPPGVQQGDKEATGLVRHESGREKAQGGWGLPGPWRIRADLEFCSDFDFTLSGPFPEECFNAPFHASSQSPLPAPPLDPEWTGS